MILSIDEDTKAIIIAGIKNGHGFTRSCTLAQISPKDLTDTVKNYDPDLLRELQEAAKFSAKALLVMSSSHLKSRAFEMWMHDNRVINEFRETLVLWEDYCKKKDVKPQTVSIGINIYKDIKELATAIGFTEPELLEYIYSNSDLELYFVEKKLL